MFIKSSCASEVWTEITKKQCSHIVISIPENLQNIEPKKLKKLLAVVKKDMGIYGSVDVLHPFRFSKDGKTSPVTSPHYHLIAFGWVKGDKVKQVYEKYGIVIHKIRTVETQKIFPLCKYLLTHAGVKPHSHAVVYTGSLSYSKLKLPKEEIEPSICPYCPMELTILRINSKYLDKPPPFNVDFIGLTDFAGFELVNDFDHHFYDSNWGMVSTKQIQLKNQLLHDSAELLKSKIAQKQAQKSRNMPKIEVFNQSAIGLS